ncbi:MAG: type I-E CRISPR-associated protein Cas7/Cse4/CasC [Synergistaceae bacterium]|jgi:CRISPR system Cascade subunit CasC|nr:type I-E CRISPR-associated protein Cas7/Cse4/CasC [Synergistaceae bacterium]
MLYEIHFLKNYPPCNLNRDDAGSPKTCVFGGTVRGRISSQSLKRAWRTSPLFKSLLQKPGVRTRHLPDMVAEKLEDLPRDVVEALKLKITGIANKEGRENEDKKTSQVVFYSLEDIEAVAGFAREIAKDKTAKQIEKIKLKEVLKEGFKDFEVRPITLDIALFGRMVTSSAFRDVEAAMQVAHAISTHTVTRESDFYTAVDDLIDENDKPLDANNDSGAAMMGDIDFNSCCYYHYAAIDTDILSENLKDSPDRRKLLEAILPAFVQILACENPTGKQNSFAAHVLPDLVVVEVKEHKVPTSYANAFAEPARIYGKNGFVGLVEDSVERLSHEIDMIDNAYGLEVKHRAWFSPRYADVKPAKAENVHSFQKLKDLLTTWSK